MSRRGPYRLLQVLSQGEQVLVAKATLEEAADEEELVLLKALNGETPETWVETMKLLSNTRSPHLRVPGKIEKDEVGPYLVTRWLPGPSLEDARIDRFGGKVPIRQALLWLQHLLLGLDVLHHHGLLHGDIKPSNLILDAEDRAVLVDLDAVQPMGQKQLLAVTDEYLIPRELDRSSAKRDLFAAALTFGALITGVVPVTSEAEPWKPSAVDPLLPQAVDQILIGVQTTDGFETTGEMKELVDELLGSGDSSATTTPTSPPTRRVAIPQRSARIGVALWLLVLLCFPVGYVAATWWKEAPTGAPYTLQELTGIDVREGNHDGQTIWQTTVLGRPVAAFSGPDVASGGETAEQRAQWTAAVLQEALLKGRKLHFDYRRELPQFSEVWLKREEGDVLLMRVTSHEKKTFQTKSPELARRWTQLSKDTLTLMGQKVAPGRSEGMLLLRPWRTRAETLAGGKNLDRAKKVQTLEDAFHSLKPDLQEDILSAYLPAEPEDEQTEEKKKETE